MILEAPNNMHNKKKRIYMGINQTFGFAPSTSSFCFHISGGFMYDSRSL